MAFTLWSPAFVHGGEMPVWCTCDDDDRAPALGWDDPPAGTRSFALVCDDPDAPDPAHPRMMYVHWVLYDIPAEARGIAEGGAELPVGTREGVNDWDRIGYGGPCPPIGRHRYFFRLYALDTVLPDLHRPTKAALLEAMRGHVLGEATLMGTYRRPGR